MGLYQRITGYLDDLLHKSANGLLDAFDKLVAGAKEAEAGNDEDAERLILEGYQILEETFEE